MNYLSIRRSVILLAAVVLFASTAAAERPITETDLFKFAWIADPQMSPDGSLVAFVRVTVDEKKDQYDTSLWLAKSDGSQPPRQLTSGVRDSSPRWSPDGSRLAFVRVVDKDGRPQPAQIYVLAMGGGEARAVTEIPRGAGNPVWSPDGQSLAFSSSARPDELDPPDKKAETEPRKSDVRVVTQAVYRANGVADFGYVDRDRPSHLWTTRLPGPAAGLATPKRLTQGEFAAGNFVWSSDGSEIYFVSNRQKEAYYYPRDSDLFAVSKDGGEPRTLVSIDGTIGAYAVSPDGQRIAFVGALHGDPETSYSQPDLWVIDLGVGLPSQPHGHVRFRHERRDRWRPARAARIASRGTCLEP